MCKNRSLAAGARVRHKKIFSLPPTSAVHGRLLDASINGFQGLNVIGTGAKLASCPGPSGGRGLGTRLGYFGIRKFLPPTHLWGLLVQFIQAVRCFHQCFYDLNVISTGAKLELLLEFVEKIL